MKTVALLIAIIFPLLIINKLKISNLWMIPILILELVAYGAIVLIWKMAIPIMIIAFIAVIIYCSQHLLIKD